MSFSTSTDCKQALRKYLDKLCVSNKEKKYWNYFLLLAGIFCVPLVPPPPIHQVVYDLHLTFFPVFSKAKLPPMPTLLKVQSWNVNTSRYWPKHFASHSWLSFSLGPKHSCFKVFINFPLGPKHSCFKVFINSSLGPKHSCFKVVSFFL